MVTIFSHKISNRLSYICEQLFTRILGCDYKIVTLESEIEGVCIWYTEEAHENGIHIIPSSILFETNIRQQEVTIGEWEGMTTLFTQAEGTIPFDLLGASFFLISRYEEYTCAKQDIHGRYPAEESIAYQQNFLEDPLVDQWAYALKKMICNLSKSVHFTPHNYQFIPTIDVDNIYAYRNHGLLQTLYCCVRDYFKGDYQRAKQRYFVVTREKKDPFFNLKKVYYLHRKKDVHPLFFFHCGTFGKYDKRTLYPSLAYRNIRKSISQKEIVGLHPSYHASKNRLFLKFEKFLMWWNPSNERPNRFHFLRFQIPQTYRILIEEGFSSDWSLCYSNKVGFRASTSHPFYFYDIEKEEQSQLLLYPTVAMDKTLKSDRKLTTKEAIRLLIQISSKIKKVNGCFITLFHNEHLSDAFDWKDWRSMYEDLITRCKS